jgi:hypothetical protein
MLSNQTAAILNQHMRDTQQGNMPQNKVLAAAQQQAAAAAAAAFLSAASEHRLYRA